MSHSIIGYCNLHRERVVALSLLAWKPVFDMLKPAVQPFVYEAFYPNGWEARQTADIAQFLDAEPENICVALSKNEVVGWMGLRLHHEDLMGEIYILAVDPDHQKSGIASALINEGFARMKAAGMTMMMVETGMIPDMRHQDPRMSGWDLRDGPWRAIFDSYKHELGFLPRIVRIGVSSRSVILA